MVETVASYLFEIVVHSFVDTTFDQSASILLFPLRSFLIKFIPVFAGEGKIVTLDFNS